MLLYVGLLSLYYIYINVLIKKSLRMLFPLVTLEEITSGCTYTDHLLGASLNKM